jgi:diguanylate cyclase (GGDEF)-like protein
MRAYQLFYVLLAVIFAMAPSLDIHLHLRVYWQSVVLIALVPTFWVLCQEVWRNNYEARVLFTGLIVFSICAINDLLINMDINTIVEVRLMSVGFLAMLISMGVSLAGRFNNMLTSLEIQVNARTAELSQVNDQLAAANQSLVEMTRIDPLTGLLNRRGLIAEAEIERQRFLRQKEPLSLVIADVDHFKQFNDVHGHACGDFVLKSVAGLFQKYIRDIDRVARWGGEEFVLLFPGTNENGLKNIADKLRQRIENHEINYEGKTLSVTLTFGCAEYRTDESLDDCLDRADAALYKGKANGRNRVEIG